MLRNYLIYLLIKVTLVDQNEKILSKALSSIKTSLQRSTKKRFEKEPQNQEKYIGDVLGRIATTSSAEQASQQADLVVEAIVENLKVKHDLFQRLDRAAPAHTVFTSNTSSLPIGDIAQVVNRKDKFGGLHFFNPG